MKTNKFSDERLLFPFCPEPYPGESIASWVIRLCGSHYYSFAQLSRLIGVKPSKSDWDLGVEVHEQKLLLDSAGVVDSAFEAFFEDRKKCPEIYVYAWARFNNAKPVYLWCPHCFASDVEPYLRWKWRLHEGLQCEQHGVELFKNCRHCWNELGTHRALLTATSAKVSYIPNLAYCGMCGNSLFDDDYLKVKSQRKVNSPFFSNLIRQAQKIKPFE